MNLLMMLSSLLKRGLMTRSFHRSCSVIGSPYIVQIGTHQPLLKRGGGVLIAVTNRLSSALPSIAIDSTVEHLWEKIFVADNVVAVGAVYLSPEIANDATVIEKHLDSALNITNSLKPGDCHLLLGDFNQSSIIWTHSSSGYLYADPRDSHFSPGSCSLLDGFSQLDMKQLNYIEHHRGRILDLIFANSDIASLCSVQRANDPLLEEDPYHPALVTSLTCNCPVLFDEIETPNEFDFQKANFSTLDYDISHIDWTPLLDASDVDGSVDFFTYTLKQLFINNVPVPRPRRKPPWSNNHLRNLKRHRSNALRKYTNLKTTESKRHFNIASNRYRSYNRFLHARYTNRIESNLKHNPKKFWSFMNAKRKEAGLPTSVFLNEEVADSCDDMCNLFAKHFSDVFRKESVDIHRINNALADVPLNALNMEYFQFSENEVLNALNKLKSSSTAGPDGIPSIVLKKCASSLCAALTIICNRSIAESRFPTKWKESIMFPVYKKGDKRDVKNYRGITSLCAGSKLLDILVSDVLLSASKSYISPDQHGFFPGRSSETNLVQFTSFCLRNIEEGNQVDAIYTDLKSAFDLVDHLILIAKMERLGAPSLFTRWLESYLRNRRLSVKIRAVQSYYFTNNSGVPQGSNLGPLLFSIFINDVCCLLPAGFRLVYADDLKIYLVVKNHEDCIELQRLVDLFEDWCIRNHLVISAQKCTVISFNRKKCPITWDYQICGTLLSRVTVVKDLGVLLDTNLSFRNHFSNIIARANRNLGFIMRSTGDFSDPFTLRSLYYSLVRSTLEYACVVWSPYTNVWILRIEAIQAKFTRYALRLLPWNDIANMPAYEIRCRLLGMESLRNRRNSLRALFAGKLLLAVIDAPNILERLNINAPSVSLRSRDPLRPDFRRTDYGINEPITALCREFNKVYHLFDYSISASVFKSRLRRFSLHPESE